MKRGFLVSAGLVALASVAAMSSVAPREVLAGNEEPGPQVLVSVDKHPAINDTIRLTYSFSGPGTGGALRVPPALPLKNLNVVGGPGTSTQITFINGSLSRTVSVTYYLRAAATGPAEVGEIVFLIGDRQVRSAPQTLEVEGARSGGPGGNADEGDDPFGVGVFPGRRAIDPRAGMQAPSRREALFDYVATPEKTTAYVGEEIAIRYDLITQADIEGLEYVDPPKFPGFWAEDLEKPEKPNGVREAYEGRAVTRFTLLKKAVAGLSAGSLTIPPARIKLAVRSAGDPFSDPFAFFQRQVIERATKPITLKVLPIPGGAKFRGPVGRFEVTSKVDHTRVTVGDALTVKVRLAGTGNLRGTAAEPPKLDVPNARVYPPTSKTEASKGGGRMGGATEWDYVVVPSAHGALTIPAASVEVFDPVEKRIVAKSSDPITIEVEGGKTPEVVAAKSAPDADAGVARTMDANETAAPPPTPRPALAQARSADPGARALDLQNRTVTLPLWTVVAVPGAFVLLLGAALAARTRQRRRAHLNAALAPEPDETKERAAGRIERALREWLKRKHAVPDGLSVSSMDSALAERGVAPDLRAELKSVLLDLEFLRFAPQLGDYDAKLAEVRGRAARLLPRLK